VSAADVQELFWSREICDFLVILYTYSIWMLFVGLFFSPKGNDDLDAIQMQPIFVRKLP